MKKKLKHLKKFNETNTNVSDDELIDDINNIEATEENIYLKE